MVSLLKTLEALLGPEDQSLGTILRVIRKKNQSANVSKSANQKKHKAEVWKPKNVGSKEGFASPKPSKPRSCLRWSPTGRLFDLKGKILTSSEFESQSDMLLKTKKIMETMDVTLDEFSEMACNQMKDCNPFFKEKGSVRFKYTLPKRRGNLLVFHIQ
ncbi:hypothetical protein Tco_1226990 [Tanacetum coccineum]